MPPFFAWIAILIVAIGSGLLTYSFTVKVVENGTKDRSEVHWVYMLVGLIMIIIGVILIWAVVRSCRMGSCSARSGEVCRAVTKDFAKYLDAQNSKLYSGIKDAHSSRMGGNPFKGEVNPSKDQK
jgi:hypothetical protein